VKSNSFWIEVGPLGDDKYGNFRWELGIPGRGMPWIAAPRLGGIIKKNSSARSTWSATKRWNSATPKS